MTIQAISLAVLLCCLSGCASPVRQSSDTSRAPAKQSDAELEAQADAYVNRQLLAMKSDPVCEKQAAAMTAALGEAGTQLLNTDPSAEAVAAAVVYQTRPVIQEYYRLGNEACVRSGLDAFYTFEAIQMHEKELIRGMSAWVMRNRAKASNR